MRRALVIAMCLAAAVFAYASQSVGLVLSGGGAKGIAHIGVIQALEDNDIPIDYISGTSMGSIVGALYAMGYTPDEMLALICSKEFQDWSTGKIDRNQTYYYARKQATPQIVSFDLNLADSAAIKSALPASLINPLPMNYGFLELFSASSAQCGGDFNKLFVPFRCVASDVYAKKPVIMRSGDLGDAVRASMSFPLVFRPILLDSVPMFDGGIYDNYPFDVMTTEFAPDMMIGVDVSAPDASAASSTMIDRVEAMIIQDPNKKMPANRGMTIRMDLSRFSLLDFGKAKEIYRLGYEKGLEMMDSVKSRVSARMPAKSLEVRRRIFRAKTPELRFDSVNVAGGTEGQNDYIRFLFTKNTTDTLSIADVRDSYYRAISNGKFSDLRLSSRYRPKSGLFTLDVDADVKNNFRLGLGGYASTSTNSFLFLSVGWNTLNYNSLDIDINGWVGLELLAVQGNAKIALRTRVPSSLSLETQLMGRQWSDTQHLIFDDALPNSLHEARNFVRLHYSLATSLSGKVDIRAGYHRSADKFYDIDEVIFTKDYRNYSLHHLFRVDAAYDYNKLDDDIYPMSGTRIRAMVAGVAGSSSISPYNAPTFTIGGRHWIEGQFDYAEYFRIGRRFVAGLKCYLMGSTQKLLPNYMASIAQAPQFTPTSACANRLNTNFRSFSSAAAGLEAIVPLTGALQLRGSGYIYEPIRKIDIDHWLNERGVRFGKWFSAPEYIAEMNLVYKLPFASISAYCNYATANTDRFNFGVTIGSYIIPQ